MEIYDRLTNRTTTGLTILEFLADNDERQSSLVEELMETCLNKISKDVTDSKTLETFRSILCSETPSPIDLRQDDSLAKSGIDSLDKDNVLPESSDVCRTNKFLILRSIATLHLVSHCNETRLVGTLNNFASEQRNHCQRNEKTKDLYKRIYKCFSDTCSLCFHLDDGRDDGNDSVVTANYIRTVMESWIKQEDKPEWRLLSCVLPKLVKTFGTENIIFPLWKKILTDKNDLGKTLAALCVMADTCFPMDKKEIEETHCRYCVQEDFWIILHRGLVSTIYQLRKQALYLVKRTLDFIESHRFKVKTVLDESEESMVPFVCTNISSDQSYKDSAKTNFFLILESLEEKQKHLVIPALSYLPSLAKAYTERKSYGYHFNVVWLRCVLKRILRHDNIAIKAMGLREALNADFNIYNEDFMDFLASSLNCISFYEFNRLLELRPEIVNQLQTFFIRSENAKLPLINTFFRAVSRLSWCPVALHWILEAMKVPAFEQDIIHNTWTDEEIICMRKLVEENLTKHRNVLRNKSLFLILEILELYTKACSEPLNAENIISASSLAINLLDLRYVYRIDNDYQLTEAVKSTDAQAYVAETCEKLVEKKSMSLFAISIILLTKSRRILCAKDCTAERALHRLFENLIGADQRPYADTSKILKAMELLCYLINFASSFEQHQMRQLNSIISQYMLETLKLMEKSFERTSISQFEEYLNAVTAVTESICRTNNILLRKAVMIFHAKCVTISIDHQKFSKNQWLYALQVLLCCSRIIKPLPVLIETDIQLVLKYLNDGILGNRENLNVASNGRFVSNCCKNVALLLEECITKNPYLCWPENIHWLEALLRLSKTENEEVIAPVARTLSKLLIFCPNLIIQNMNSVHSIIHQSERLAFQLNKTETFFDAANGLTLFLVNSDFLRLDKASELVNDWVDRLMEEGQNVPALRCIFIKAMERLGEKDVLHFRKNFLRCCFQGPVLRSDQKIQYETTLHCTSSLNPKNEFPSPDVEIRARSVMILVNLSKESKRKKSEFREKILQEILSILEKNLNKRYFDNSGLHRLKHRAMQILLILEPYLNGEERKTLHSAICNFLISESNQPSVRLMQEWLLVRIYANDTDLQGSIWELFQLAIEKRPGSIVSIASIVYHVSRLLEKTIQVDFIGKAITNLLPNCMSQQFNVRLYSQVILVKMYEMLPKNCRELNKYHDIYEAVTKSLERGKAVDHYKKITSDFYFTLFHPNDDYNLEFIYDQLPRLTDLPSDECIKSDWFKYLTEINFSFCAICPKFDRSLQWITTIRIRKTQKAKEISDEPNEDGSVDAGLSDIQKKIIPWKSMLSFSDEFSETSEINLSRQELSNEKGGIIVVASLIDRPPNLGGLARTCEIFGVKELVIGNLKYVDNREFQTLSVTAEKWITITEVKPHQLKNYLLQQRSNGWKLVGAEQTANSKNLLQMEFDKKTILLLGNEKDGIPANLIPILDTCVEIPQNGVIRSLNVHVSGAICIWQYMKQHLNFVQT